MLRCAAGSTTCTALTTGTNQYLSAVWGTDANNIYAVGNGGTVLRRLP